MLLRACRALAAGWNRTFVPLLAALIVVLVATPLAEGMPRLAATLVVVVLLAGILAVHNRPSLRVGMLLILSMVLVLRWVAHTYGDGQPRLVTASHGAIAAYMLLLGTICLTTVLHHERITRDTVLGAVCGYILIAYVFTFLYAALEDHQPASFTASFTLPAREGARIGHLTPELMYFSFTTLTTVGYGDIVPASRLARSLSILEMLAGQLYLAAFVARLVGVMGKPTRPAEP